jgi:hypothetical protein
VGDHGHHEAVDLRLCRFFLTVHAPYSSSVGVEASTCSPIDLAPARFGRFKDARLVYADYLTLLLAIRNVGTETNAEKLLDTVREAIQAFMRFINPALDEQTIRKQQAGAQIEYKLEVLDEEE